MGRLAIILVILCFLFDVGLSGLLFLKDFNVLYFGALGDGYTDDSQAFLRAWDFMCNSPSAESASMIIPEGKTFLVNPVVFKGPCKPKIITFQIFGTITSPRATETWNGMDSSEWLAFRSVSGLIVEGGGTIDGQGKNWWLQSCRNNHRKGCTKMAPTALKFHSCQDCYLRNLHFVDSANTHIAINKCEWFHVTNVRVDAPKWSPNTDGIHIERSNHVFIDHANIRSGDDCISIGDHTSDIRVSNINCGPGHGISIGSLGKGGSYVQVENIHVSNVNFYQTTNGVRIKTWQGATGYARDITFKYLNFTSVQNPIIIDQYYCNKLYLGNCKAVEKSDSGVQISNVTYKNAIGTSSTNVAITLICSKSVACSEILLDSIQLTTSQLHKHQHQHDQVTSKCYNAQGRTKGIIQPSIPCLVQE
ncbi:hypothetical protein ACHQM5_029100 [Ranunculus cassubicifolius]